jgi:hypothetical protein
MYAFAFGCLGLIISIMLYISIMPARPRKDDGCKDKNSLYKEICNKSVVRIDTSLEEILDEAFAGSSRLSDEIAAIRYGKGFIPYFILHKGEISGVNFSGCTRMTMIGESAFYNNEISSIAIPNSVKIIKEYAFAYNKISSVVPIM